MGNNSSTNLKTYIQNNINIEQSVSVIMKANAETESIVLQNAIATTSLNNPKVCCAGMTGASLNKCTEILYNSTTCAKGVSIDIKQNSKVNISSKSSADISNEIKNDLSGKIESKVKEAVKQLNKNGWFSLPGNNQNYNSETRIINSINASMNETITAESISKIKSSVFQNANSSVDICGNVTSDGSCKINIETLNTVYVKNIADLVANTIASNSAAVSLFNATKKSSKQTQTNFINEGIEGIRDLLSGAGSGIYRIIIIIVVIGGIIAGVVAVKYFKGDKKDESEQSSNTQAIDGIPLAYNQSTAYPPTPFKIASDTALNHMTSNSNQVNHNKVSHNKV